MHGFLLNFPFHNTPRLQKGKGKGGDLIKPLSAASLYHATLFFSRHLLVIQVRINPRCFKRHPLHVDYGRGYAAIPEKWARGAPDL